MQFWAAALVSVSMVAGAAGEADRDRESAAPEADWREHERGRLENHVQLTFRDRFTRAGEAYFSPDDSKIIFQATEVPAAGEEPSEFYAMFVADVVRDASGRMTGIDNIRRISPEDSANTCGWFHPRERGLVLFASTVRFPEDADAPGYQRGTGRYRWMFPPEMDIVTVHLDQADGTAAPIERLVSNPEAYIAEGSWSPDGRHVLYCSLETNQGDLYVLDTETGRTTRIVEAQGYDGGPFFSPDGKRICYRSDRRGNNLLQIFIGELEFNAEGTIIGLNREFQITDNEHVNWAPFWHPGGRHLVYATSEIGHHNYEVFIIDADPGYLEGSEGSVKYGTRKRRVTHSRGFDGLPVFNSTGEIMMWTSQRSEDGSSQLWIADFVMELDPVPTPAGYRRP